MAHLLFFCTCKKQRGRSAAHLCRPISTFDFSLPDTCSRIYILEVKSRISCKSSISVLEFSRSLYLCNHLSESIHSWTKGTLPQPTPAHPYPTPSPPYPTLPNSYTPYPALPHPPCPTTTHTLLPSFTLFYPTNPTPTLLPHPITPLPYSTQPYPYPTL